MSEDAVVTLIKTDDRIIILKDGKVYNYWYIENYTSGLRMTQVDSLNSYLFGDDCYD